MMKVIEPEVGCWYKSALDSQEFEVVALDDDDETVEIQYADGDVEELERENWYRMELSTIITPEDWQGPYEFEPEDGGMSLQKPDAWDNLDDFDFNE